MTQTLSRDELLPFLRHVCDRYFTRSEGEPRMDERLFFDIVDVTGDGEVSWPEFLWFALFLKRVAGGVLATYDTTVDGATAAAADPDGLAALPASPGLGRGAASAAASAASKLLASGGDDVSGVKALAHKLVSVELNQYQADRDKSMNGRDSAADVDEARLREIVTVARRAAARSAADATNRAATAAAAGSLEEGELEAETQKKQIEFLLELVGRISAHHGAAHHAAVEAAVASQRRASLAVRAERRTLGRTLSLLPHGDAYLSPHGDAYLPHGGPFEVLGRLGGGGARGVSAKKRCQVLSVAEERELDHLYGALKAAAETRCFPKSP